MDPLPATAVAPSEGRTAYRVAFVAGLLVLAAAIVAGFGRVAARDGGLPGLAQDPLLEAAYATRSGQPALARSEYAAATLLNPSDGVLMLQIGVALRLAGEHEEAAAMLRRSIELRPRAVTHAQLGWTLLETGRVDEAAASFEAAIRSDPRQPEALAGLGEVWLSRDRYPLAISAFEAAIAAGAASATTYNSYGIALSLAGRPADGERAFEAAVRLSPTADIVANLERARTAARTGSR